MDIVDQWLHSSEEAALALKSLFVQLPALLPSCLSMLSTRHHIGYAFYTVCICKLRLEYGE